jgi:hypothetical protein
MGCCGFIRHLLLKRKTIVKYILKSQKFTYFFIFCTSCLYLISVMITSNKYLPKKLLTFVPSTLHTNLLRSLTPEEYTEAEIFSQNRSHDVYYFC